MFTWVSTISVFAEGVDPASDTVNVRPEVLLVISVDNAVSVLSVSVVIAFWATVIDDWTVDRAVDTSVSVLAVITVVADVIWAASSFSWVSLSSVITVVAEINWASKLYKAD